VGHHLPEKVVTNDDLAQIMPTSHEWIVQRTGIEERRFSSETGRGASEQAVVVHDIQRCGNTTAATIPIGLSESWAEGRLNEATVLSSAFGSGFTWAGSVVRFGPVEASA